MTEKIIKQIDDSTVTLVLTIDEARIVRHALAKEEVEKGIPTDRKLANVCPICNRAFSKGDDYCPGCGQKVEFVDSDTIPL